MGGRQPEVGDPKPSETNVVGFQAASYTLQDDLRTMLEGIESKLAAMAGSISR